MIIGTLIALALLTVIILVSIIPNYIGFMTGYGSSGDWIVENNLSGIPFIKLLPFIDAHWLAVDSC